MRFSISVPNLLCTLDIRRVGYLKIGRLFSRYGEMRCWKFVVDSIFIILSVFIVLLIAYVTQALRNKRNK